MFTRSYVVGWRIAGRERQIEIDADLLNALWSAHEGPQTAEGIVQANLATIEGLIANQIVEGLVDPDGSQPVILAGLDRETELGDEFELMGPMN